MMGFVPTEAARGIMEAIDRDDRFSVPSCVLYDLAAGLVDARSELDRASGALAMMLHAYEHDSRPPDGALEVARTYRRPEGK